MKQLILLQILLFALFAGCKQIEQQDQCFIASNAQNNFNSFIVDINSVPKDKNLISFKQQIQILHGAYEIGHFLVPSDRHDTASITSYYYGKSTVLNRHSVCNTIIYSAADDFKGLYLVTKNTNGGFFNLYVAGVKGIGVSFEPERTISKFLNDSIIQVKTGWTWLALRNSKEKSFTDTTTKLFRVNYHNNDFVLEKTDSSHTSLSKYFN